MGHVHGQQCVEFKSWLLYQWYGMFGLYGCNILWRWYGNIMYPMPKYLYQQHNRGQEQS